MMKFIMKKKFFIVVVTMFLCFIILDKIFIIKIKYRTNLEPVHYYSVEISRINKKLKIVENKYCSEEDCNDELVRKSINLTNQEYAYIKNILSFFPVFHNLFSAVISCNCCHALTFHRSAEAAGGLPVFLPDGFIPDF